LVYFKKLYFVKYRYSIYLLLQTAQLNFKDQSCISGKFHKPKKAN